MLRGRLLCPCLPKAFLQVSCLFFIITITLLLSFMLPTLGEESEWSKTYSDSHGRGNYIIKTTDGCFAIAGVSNRQFLLAKTDSTGALAWWKTYQIGEAKCVIQTSDGGYAVVGGGDVNFIKTDSLGNIQWSKNFVNGTTTFKINSLSQTPDGGYILSGYTPSGNYPQWDMTVKTDSKGTVIWSKSFGTQSSQSFATNVLAIENGYILAANSRLYGLNLNGEIQWSEPLVVASSLAKTSDGGYIVASGTGSVITKTDSQGRTQWSEAYKLGAPQKLLPEYSFLHSAVQTKDGGFIACGIAHPVYEGVAWIVKIDSTGKEVWNTTASPFSGHNSHANSIIEVSDGVYVFTGAIESISNPSYSDVWLVKVSNSILPASNSMIPSVEDNSPTPNMSPTLTPTPIPTNNTSQPTPTPSVPEFPPIIILTLLIATTLSALVVYFKKHKRSQIP